MGVWGLRPQRVQGRALALLHLLSLRPVPEPWRYPVVHSLTEHNRIVDHMQHHRGRQATGCSEQQRIGRAEQTHRQP